MRSLYQRLFLAFFTLVLSGVAVFGQGVTTGSINGRITDQAGEPLIGANVLAVHVPTGTIYGNSTNEDGFYRIANMRVGGPYSITVSYTGYEDLLKEGIFLQLGQAFKFDAALAEQAILIEGVEVVAYRNDIFDGNRTGAETTVDERTINVLPTVARSLGDFTRLTPQGTVTEGGDGFALSFNGMNNRYNAIYIDGAVNNDVFGLAGSGTNGGQTGVSPISVDAIEEFQVSLAPFDVRVGGFAGAAINAVTRSGSNNLEGSAYYFFRNEALAGKSPIIEGVETGDRTRLNDFTASTFGFRLGGPIVKNKAFFFFNAEVQRDETPRPFDPATYLGEASEGDLTTLSNFLVNTYGYDPGTYTDNLSFLNSEKFTARLDFNLSQKNKLSLRGSMVNARNLEGVQSFATGIRYLNSSEYFESTTYSAAAELNTILGVNAANRLILGYTAVRDDRDPYDPTNEENYFPSVIITDGASTIRFGSEQFSTANQLDQDVYTLTNNFELYKGRHTITIGTHNEFYSVYNLFIRQNYGVYEYDSLAQFLNQQNATEYYRSYSLRDDITGDGSIAAAEFTGAQFGLYVQDEWQVNDNFKLTAGVRADLPMYFSDTPENAGFNDSTTAKIESFGYDLAGATTGAFIEPSFLISPRLGFNLDLSGGEKKTQLRGGVGIFSSRLPLVWPGGAFVNNGLTVGGDFISNPDFGVHTYPEWDNQPRNVKPGEGLPSGQIDLFASDFKVPQVLKANLALDQKLPGGLVLTLDGIFNKTLNNVYYQNLNIKPSDVTLTGTGDNRILYNRNDRIEGIYSPGIYLATNTNQGYTYNGTISLTKPFENGFSGMVAYSYGDAYSIFDGTSSQNSSQWRGQHAINGRNFVDEISRSDFAQGHRIISYVSYEFPLGGADNKKNNMVVTLFYEGAQGSPYSYIYNDNGRVNNEDTQERNLIYVPENQSDIILIEKNGVSPEDQWNALNEFIENDPYLSTRRGEYAERNSNFLPWSHIVDLRLLRNFNVQAGKKDHTLQLSLDVFNFTNLLNKNWGKRYAAAAIGSNFNNYELINFESFQADGTTPQFSVNTSTFDGVIDRAIDDSGIQSSRWQMQVGVRYIFQ